MPPRLTELYRLGESVEVFFDDASGDDASGDDASGDKAAGGRWVAGRIVAHQHPGVWVETPDARRWFVTNGKRIRVRPDPTGSIRISPTGE